MLTKKPKMRDVTFRPFARGRHSQADARRRCLISAAPPPRPFSPFPTAWRFRHRRTMRSPKPLRLEVTFDAPADDAAPDASRVASAPATRYRYS